MSNQSFNDYPVGAIINGKYRVEKHLGRGGMGIVVAARHVDLRTLFAIKLMHRNNSANSLATDRFVREARAAVQLGSNEHVVHVHDVGRLDSGEPFIVMELLVGEDLSMVLEKRRVLPIDEACLHVAQACHAIAEAHELGLVHRDLKPANLFLTRRKDGSSCIKVLDFGIAKQLDDDVELTKMRDVLGSPLYMSPEQAKSAKNVDARTDTWSLGVILYKLLTGKSAITGSTYAEVIAALLDPAAVLAPSTFRSDIPNALDAVILRCLEKDAARRYATIKEFEAALRPFTTKQHPSWIGSQHDVAPPSREHPRPPSDCGTPSATVVLAPEFHAMAHDALHNTGTKMFSPDATAIDQLASNEQWPFRADTSRPSSAETTVMGHDSATSSPPGATIPTSGQFIQESTNVQWGSTQSRNRQDLNRLRWVMIGAMVVLVSLMGFALFMKTSSSTTNASQPSARGAPIALEAAPSAIATLVQAEPKTALPNPSPPPIAASASAMTPGPVEIPVDDAGAEPKEDARAPASSIPSGAKAQNHQVGVQPFQAPTNNSKPPLQSGENNKGRWGKPAAKSVKDIPW